MQWSSLLGKLSPERIHTILREGQCKPVSDYNKTPNMPPDRHGSLPDHSEAEDPDESGSIGDSSLLAPPMSRRQPYNYIDPQAGRHELQTVLDDRVTSPDLPIAFAPTRSIGSAAAPSGPMHSVTHSEYSDVLTLPNPHPLSPHPPQLHGRASPPNVPPPQQSLVYPDGYAPVESLPPQNYISSTRTVPSSSAPFFPPGSRGTSIFRQTQGATPLILGNPSPTTLVPLNSELARPPRFTFAPPGANVPADTVASTTSAPPASPRSWRERAKAKHDKSSQQAAQDSSGGRARSHSWSVVSSVSVLFRRRSGRQSGPAALTTTADAQPHLTASDWRDLAQWAYRPTDNFWGENFDVALPIELEAGPSSYDHSLPHLPPHLSHLPAPSPPLLRPNSSTCALNPFLAHRIAGLPPLSWDLRVGANAILFPVSGPGAPALPMAPSDYAQPATWPPCGALRIGAVGGHAGWRWPVEARNPAGVRCGDVFRALVANLHAYVRPHELADMLPEHVAVIAAACAARVTAGFPPGVSSSEPSGPPDGIRRVDCLLGYTQFHGLEPGPGTGEWTLFVGAP